MRNSEEKRTMNKTRKAFDWVLSCLIRLPVFIIFLAMSVFSVGFIMFIISPENVLNALRSIGIML